MTRPGRTSQVALSMCEMMGKVYRKLAECAAMPASTPAMQDALGRLEAQLDEFFLTPCASASAHHRPLSPRIRAAARHRPLSLHTRPFPSAPLGWLVALEPRRTTPVAGPPRLPRPLPSPRCVRTSAVSTLSLLACGVRRGTRMPTTPWSALRIPESSAAPSDESHPPGGRNPSVRN